MRNREWRYGKGSDFSMVKLSDGRTFYNAHLTHGQRNGVEGFFINNDFFASSANMHYKAWA